jgi:hypothetical protein
VQVTRVERRLCEPTIVLRHVGGEEGVGLVDGGDVVEPHSLDQSVLQRGIGSLPTSLGLWRVRADELDVEPVQRAPKVRHAVTVRRGRVVAEGAVFVRVEGNRLAVPLEVRPRGTHVGEGALALDHLQVHELARSIVDEHQERALRTAVLEPPVLRAVDLDKLAAAVAPIAWLVKLGALGDLGLPQSGFHHDLSQRLTGEPEAMPLGEILAG